MNSSLMNPHWQQLTDLEPDSKPGADPEALLRESVLVPLQHYGFLSAEGPDSHQFLQGQTTCDFRQVTTAEARGGAYCTPKGRMLASFVAAGVTDQHLLLRMRGDIVESTLTVLGKYAVFSKVELSDAGNDYLALGLAGHTARALLQETCGAAPEQCNAVTPIDGGIALQMDDAGERFELWLRNEQAETTWRKLSESAATAPAPFWDWLNLRAGVADVGAATREEFLPQMFNYDLTGAVNFKKGCYTGQEVVARLHFRGSAKQRLFIGHSDAVDIQAGDSVQAGDKPQAVGTVAGAVALDGRSELAVVLRVDAAERNDLSIKGSGLRVEAPPYLLDT